MRETPGNLQSDVANSLGLPRGLPVQVGLEDQPPIPDPIESIADLNVRQRAKEIWTTAFRLESILLIWMDFPILFQMGMSVDSSTQEKISRSFPELKGFGDILTRMVVKETEGVGAQCFPLQETADLILWFSHTIKTMIEALLLAGIVQKYFDVESLEVILNKIVNVNISENFGEVVFKVDSGCCPAAAEMRSKAARLRRQLETIPTSVLGPCPQSPPNTPRWDRENRKLWLGATLCKEYRRQPAPNQLAILNTFEDDGWLGGIDDPLSGREGQTEARRRQRLKDAVRGLNSIPFFTFRLDGTGKRISYEASTEPPPSSPN